jgi:FkbM family methyltransferase
MVGRVVAERMISYAQNAEDVVLSRAFPGREDGFYVDVGANDPTHDSVTRAFYDRGWSGINIEPVPAVFERLAAERERDVNLNVGISDAEGTLVMQEFTDVSAVSTFDAGLTEHWRAQGFQSAPREVPVVTLSSVFAEHVGEREVDFLKVDVEGYERQVFSGFDLERWRPRIILAEQNFHETWEPLVVGSGYRRALFDGLNYFFVREEDADVLGPALGRPASVVLDAYDPWTYVQQLRQAGDEIHRLRGELEAARAPRRRWRRSGAQ